jgi:hypothetical protein
MLAMSSSLPADRVDFQTHGEEVLPEPTLGAALFPPACRGQKAVLVLPRSLLLNTRDKSLRPGSTRCFCAGLFIEHCWVLLLYVHIVRIILK